MKGLICWVSRNMLFAGAVKHCEDENAAGVLSFSAVYNSTLKVWQVICDEFSMLTKDTYCFILTSMFIEHSYIVLRSRV